MESLNSIEDEPKVFEMKIKGAPKKIKIDVEKLREAVTFEEDLSDPEEAKAVSENIDISAIEALKGETEEQYLQRVKKQLHLRKTDHGTLVKDSTLKLFKCVGEYVRLCANELKA